MTTKIGRCIFVGASIEKIYDLLLDAKQMPDWFVGIQKLELSDDFPYAGGTARITFRHQDVILQFTMTGVELVNGEYGVFELSGDLIGTQRWTTKPERGGYRLYIDYEYDLPVSGLTKFVERITRETLTQSLANFKHLLEKEYVSAFH